MNLGEKITYARRKLGMSQIDLADAMNVSRQSVSKWEIGESNPEITKLKQLAEVLKVSLDWLLSEDDMSYQSNSTNVYTQTYPKWVEHLPNGILSLIKKHGWIYGLQTALSGFFFAGFGLFALSLTHMFLLGSWGLTTDYYDEFAYYDPTLEMNLKSWSIFSAMATFVIVVGLAVALFGIIIAIALKKWGEKNSNS